VTASSLEDSLHIGPIQERTLFMNRGKFDLVVVYDRSSRTLDAPPPPAPSGHLAFSPITSTSTSKKSALSVLVNTIYPNRGRETTNAFSKKLRNAPVLLVGGMEAWKRDVGDAGIAKSEGAGGASESRASARGAPSASTPVQPRPVLPSSPSLAFMSGVNGSSSPSSPVVGGYQYRAGFGIDGKVDRLPSRYGRTYARLIR
jgi:ubiquitin carboxyl-terminal hydrolase 8